MMYDYRKFQLQVLTKSLKEFEAHNRYNLPEDTMDKIWDVSIKALGNERVKKFFGRYYIRAKTIEIVPHMFKGNMVAYKDTIIHELAHHICDTIHGDTESHGKEWKQVCEVLGCHPSATKNLSHFALEWSQVKNNDFYRSFEC